MNFPAIVSTLYALRSTLDFSLRPTLYAFFFFLGHGLQIRASVCGCSSSSLYALRSTLYALDSQLPTSLSRLILISHKFKLGLCI